MGVLSPPSTTVQWKLQSLAATSLMPMNDGQGILLPKGISDLKSIKNVSFMIEVRSH